MTEHDKQESRIIALENGQKEILDLLRPISDTYKTATMIGKWSMAALVFISVLTGTLLSVKDIIKK